MINIGVLIMKVLSIKEPFASLIMNGIKKIETRSWKTNYRGELYIHASISKISKEWYLDNDFIKLIKDISLNYGYIICKCKLVDCIYMSSEYIEKDFGCSFPKYYIWGQGNNFQNSSCCFMFSIADIPFKLFSFRGLICSLIINNKEYRFATYNGSKILKYEVNDFGINLILKKGKYILTIESKNRDSFILKAPVDGELTKDIYESINSEIKVVLKKGKKIIFDDISFDCGLEVVF